MNDDPADKYPSFRKEGSYTVTDCKATDEKGVNVYYIRYKSDVHDFPGMPYTGRTQQEAVEKCKRWVRGVLLRRKA